MKLIVVHAGEPYGNYIPRGCATCTEIVNDGDLLALYDDGEYFPTFCVRCVAVIRELFDRVLAEKEVDLAR